MTGFTIFEHAFAGKWLEMLKEVVPGIIRVAVLQNPDHPAWNSTCARSAQSRPDGRRGHGSAGKHCSRYSSRNPRLCSCPERRPHPAAEPGRHRASRTDCQRRITPGLPSIYLARIYPMSGGLMSYGINLIQLYRHHMFYVRSHP